MQQLLGLIINYVLPSLPQLSIVTGGNDIVAGRTEQNKIFTDKVEYGVVILY